MSNLYINTLQIVAGFLTPVIVFVLLIIVKGAIETLGMKIEERRTQLQYKPEFQVRLHKVPNPNMWGVEISKDGKVLQDVGVDKL